jgi:type I restriction enzyme S subunit
MGGLMSRLVPKLRFKEFSGEWEEKTLKDIASFINEKVPLRCISLTNYISTENLLSDFNGITEAKKLPNISNVTKFKKDDILMSNIRPYLKKVWLSNIEGGSSNDIIVARVKENNYYKFLFYIMQDDKFINYVMKGAKGVKMPRGDILLVKKYPLVLPIPKEQQKIASCLSSLDALIEAQNKKVSVLKQHKKGLMQQLFPKSGETTPTLRFKAFSGEWEEKIISDLANRYDNLRIPIAASNRIEGVTPYYGANGIQSYIQGYTHDGEYILVAEDGANDLQNYPVQYVNGKVWVNNHTHVLQGKKGISNNIFLMHAIQNTNIRPYLVGGGRAKLNANIMMKISFLVPKPKEQQKIANTLSTLDNLIEAQNQQINHLKQHKKGLMQQLFVNSEVGA